MISIEEYKFDANAVKKIENTKYGKKWPVVYIINNNKEAYIGETINAYVRTRQHLENPKRQKLNLINIISDEKFNKSVILNLESFLIKYMAADNKYILQNGNAGLQNHNYYQKELYEKQFKDIWNQLREKGIVQNALHIIENSDLFKYSPYKSLTDDQYEVVRSILVTLAEDMKNNTAASFIVHGGAGTGKTILGIYLLKLLIELKENNIDIEEKAIDDNLYDFFTGQKISNKLKIGLVIPMDNLRKTLKKVFKNVSGLTSNMVLSPNDVAKSKEKYDLLIVDEAHRLRRRKNLTQYAAFDQNNSKFNLGREGTELDWIRLQSKYQIFLYDEDQSIKHTDINKEKIKEMESETNSHTFKLKTQVRCLLGGDEYVKYVKEIFSNTPPKKKTNFKEYEFKIFDNVDEMVNNIKTKNEIYGLCRNVAGYAWKWNTKGKKLPMHMTKKELKDIEKNQLYDIEIDGYKYIWNSQPVDWINSENSINEIGSIHTTQGFDLNYTGLIIGNELKYDDEKNIIYVDRKEYYDAKGKADTSDEELLNYILHIYIVMCTRGMRGTYLYVCDEKLRKYLGKYIDKYEGFYYETGEHITKNGLKVAEESAKYEY
ncbi:MAG: DUF2075 domain-containing protein [Clostridia bacterium]|nr:DUF2075 domain-containing protein [Clostridia bacterium]